MADAPARAPSRWTRRAQAVQARVRAARGDHASIDLCLSLFERDAVIGGGLLAGALAYRLFVFLLPTSLLLVSGLGLYAGAVDKSPSTVAQEAGLHGLIASEVAATAGGRHRALVFLVMLPAFSYATVVLYRATAKVHAIAWHRSARGVRITPRGAGIFTVALLLQLAAVEIVGWIRRRDELGGLAALLAYLLLAGGAWLAVSLELPHGAVHWSRLLPGALLFGVGLLCINVFNVYVTTRLVENQAHTYGALGVAAALLFSLVLVGRLMVVSAELNASLDERRSRPETREPGSKPEPGSVTRD